VKTLAIPALFSPAQTLNGVCSGHNHGSFDAVDGVKLAQKLQYPYVNFPTPFYPGEFDGQDRRRRDEHGERQRSQVR
jgi:hypothetical protein